MSVSAPGRSRVPVLAAVLLSVTNFLVVFDGLVVTVALPAIQRALGMSQEDGQWIITGYTLALAGALLLGGRFGDRFGRRRLLMVGLAVFATGLLGAGTAPDAAVLLAGRIAQGLGAALAVPNTYALISAMPSALQRNRIFTASGLAGSSGSACGALAGGAIAQTLGWRAVFLVSAPVAIAALLAAPHALDAGHTGDRRRLDVVAAVLSSLGLALLVFGITNIGRAGLTAWSTLGALAAAVLVAAGFVLRERRAAVPLIDLRLLRLSALRAAMAGMPGQVFAYNGTVYLGLLFLQQVAGYSPLHAGLAFAPLGAAAFVGAPLAIRLIDLRRWSLVVAASLATAAAGLVLLAWTATRPTGYLAGILPGFLLIGFGIAIAAVTLNAAAGRDAPAGNKGVIYGMFETSTHVSGAVAVAVLATVVVIGQQTAAATTPTATATAATGYRWAFLTAAGAALAGAGLTYLLDKTGQE